MEHRICTLCNKNVPATSEYFHKKKNGKYGLGSRCKECQAKRIDSAYVHTPKKTEKKCGRCKEVFPLTGEYFYTKTTKKGTIIKGFVLKEDCTSFRSVCKKCNSAESLVRKRKKLMVKYNVSTDKELDKVIYASRIKSGKLGNKAVTGKPSPKRIYDYPENATRKEISLISTKRRIETLANSYVAAAMRLKLKDIPPEIVELKRKQLKFYRHVKSKKDQIRNSK